MPDPNKLCISYDSTNQTYTVRDFDNPPKVYTERPFPIKKNGHLHFEVDCGYYGIAIIGSDSEGSGAKDPKKPGVVFRTSDKCSESNGDPNVIQVREDKVTPDGYDIQIFLFCLDANGTIQLLPDNDDSVTGGPRMKVVA